MGTVQKWLMHVQPMHEQLPRRRQAKVQTVMQLYELVWYAKHIAKQKIEQNELKLKKKKKQTNQTHLPANVRRHERQYQSMHHRRWILLLNLVLTLATVRLEYFVFLTKIAMPFPHHIRIRHSSDYFAIINAYLLNVQRHLGTGPHEDERFGCHLEVYARVR